MEPHGKRVPAAHLPPLIPPSRPLPSNGSASLADGRVVPALREAIIEGTLAGGTRLSEAQIAARYGVSRTPVRQALLLLEREGLVVSHSRAGTYVRTFDARDVYEVFEVREALESQAARGAAHAITPAGRTRLREQLAALTAALEDQQPAAFAQALDGFYELIIELTGNATMQRVYRGLAGPVRRLRRIGLRYPDRGAAARENAVAIVAAIEAGDGLAAERAVRDQLRTGRHATMAMLAP